MEELNIKMEFDDLTAFENTIRMATEYIQSANDLDINLLENGNELIADDLEQGEIVEDCEEKEQVPKFVVSREVIPSVAKSDQADELQDLEGLSVYNQETLEAGILKQVDDALDNELDGSLSAVEETAEGTATSKPFDINNLASNETDMERSIRLGEMTPFGTTLHCVGKSNLKSKQRNTELSILEKYLRKQEELNKKHQITNDESKPKKVNKDPLKRKVLNRNGKKRKSRKKENLGTETEDCGESKPKENPGQLPGEKSYMYPENATDSEYVPTESELETSDDEKKWSGGKIVLKNPMKTKRKKIPLAGYKIPEDWRSDDSDWESSDEEYKKKKRRRSAKELDDGDIEMYKLRIEEWKENNKVNKENEQFHKFDGGYKIPLHVWDKLYNYQKVGVRWLWELDRQRCGGILGDEMGLGKTIQVITFLVGLQCSEMKDKDTGYRGLGPSIIICPTTVMHQWVREFHTWFPHLRVAVLHESGTYSGKKKAGLVQKLYTSGSGVLVMSYTGAVLHKDELIPRNWHYVILDEGHKIRNPDAKVTLAVKQMKTSHRIILSGSPMQNNLRELWSLFDFIFPGKLGTLPVFLEQFAVPITQGGYANASEVQVVTAFKCATILKDTISPYLLRRMKSDVKSHINLPEKNEQVLFCKLTEEQTYLYKGYVNSGEVDRILDGRLQIFMGLISLRKICNHPDLFSGGLKLLNGEKEEDFPEEERYGHWSKSGKMIVVETLLKIWKKQGHRVLLFTQGQQMLCILESFVKNSGYKYLKLDGSTSISSRQPLINKFNQDTSYFLMLLTTRVGGLGVNLTGANRVVIYDPDWNPATDTQARERAWRIGQKQNVTVYRLITAGTIEEKMYHRQIFKQFLTNKVLKDPRQRRFFKSNDLFELFTLKETSAEGSTETSAIFAGTNSEVKLDPRKSYRYKNFINDKPKIEAEKPSVTFSKKKIEHMKKLAQKLSLNFNTKNETTTTTPNLNISASVTSSVKNCTITSNSLVTSDEQSLISENSLISNESNVNSDTKSDLDISNNFDKKNNNCSSDCDVKIKDEKDKTMDDPVNITNTDLSNSDSCTENKLKIEIVPSCCDSSSNKLDFNFTDYNCHLKTKKKRDKHKSKRKFEKFEGETVPHLVKQSTANNQITDENEEAKQIATQDEYVLKKLFDKSGLQTAMKHDNIMEGGPSDYALVEGEAEKVASKAVAALKESRRECNVASSGLPTFTGFNGVLKRFKPKFGTLKKSEVNELSSSALLQKIRQRNLESSDDGEEIKVLKNIREFLSSQGGTAGTDKIINKFKDCLPVGKTAVFKALLSNICVFYRAPDNKGYWTLKDEFM